MENFIIFKKDGMFADFSMSLATLEAGLAAGTLEAGFGGALGADGGALPKVGDDLPLDRLPPRGIIIVSELETLRERGKKAYVRPVKQYGVQI
ncbi:hypothetical protein P5673_000520 [Acropora cervicornis]|uniref:Uncharacterized protein n=1 Tax=Acropora cervicornis TaxID=6130 RepID=A0AAD9R797_ACRCE|nr:hypothetical protein P5673_000520 [Acropora cervicornis]